MTTSPPSIVDSYRQMATARAVWLVALALLVLLTALVALSWGAADLSPFESIRALLGLSEKGQLVLRQLRLPRVLIGLLVGSGLATAGTVCQAVLRNPLASPFTLGVASGAAFGAVLAIVAGASSGVGAAAAFALALLTTALVMGVAHLRGGATESLVLAGVALMFLFSALTSLLQYLGTMEQVHAIVFWTLGSLSKAGWTEIAIASAMIGLPGLALMIRAWDLNLLACGDDVAQTVGVNAKRGRYISLFLASLICAGAIAFTGVIGFIGLVAPHIGRALMGNDHRLLLPASALIGALVVVLADTAARTLWAPQVIPIGIMTSFIGVPFFLYLLLRRRDMA